MQRTPRNSVLLPVLSRLWHMHLVQERQRREVEEKVLRTAQEEAKKRSDGAKVEKEAQRRRLKAERGRLKAMCEAGGRCACGDRYIYRRHEGVDTAAMQGQEAREVQGGGAAPTAEGHVRGMRQVREKALAIAQARTQVQFDAFVSPTGAICGNTDP